MASPTKPDTTTNRGIASANREAREPRLDCPVVPAPDWRREGGDECLRLPPAGSRRTMSRPSPIQRNAGWSRQSESRVESLEPDAQEGEQRAVQQRQALGISPASARAPARRVPARRTSEGEPARCRKRSVRKESAGSARGRASGRRRCASRRRSQIRPQEQGGRGQAHTEGCGDLRQPRTAQNSEQAAAVGRQARPDGHIRQPLRFGSITVEPTAKAVALKRKGDRHPDQALPVQPRNRNEEMLRAQTDCQS